MTDNTSPRPNPRNGAVCMRTVSIPREIVQLAALLREDTQSRVQSQANKISVGLGPSEY